MSDYLLVATPFLRMKISYRRIRKASAESIGTLFPPNTVSGLKRDIIEPFWSYNALVLYLTALPIPASTLRLFLSPFFFKDNTPHLVILIKDWMRFSTEMESLRIGGDAPDPVRPPNESILARLPRK
jgi:hypothetical protein